MSRAGWSSASARWPTTRRSARPPRRRWWRTSSARGRLRAIRTFIYGVVVGVAALFALALLTPRRSLISRAAKRDP